MGPLRIATRINELMACKALGPVHSKKSLLGSLLLFFTLDIMRF